jgi:hypothetical protein
MTYRISSEALGDVSSEAFAALVEAHIATLREYDAHEAIVRKHAADPDMKPEDRWTTLAVPVPAPEIDAAIRRTPKEDGTTEFAADYELVGPSLEAKKQWLVDLVSAAEHQAMIGVLAPRKVRAYQFHEADILKADAARRSPQDRRFLEEQAAREDQRQEIARWGANLHCEIEDLTEETIDGFEVKPFHG